MPIDFYDKVAGKFGKYSSGVETVKEFFTRDPEEVFRQKVIGVAGKNKVALDVGCADGRFTLSMAPHYAQVVAIDLSRGMLKAARELQAQEKIGNVNFEEKDAADTGFPGGFFEVIWSRRGPTPYPEFGRLLKKGGNLVIIEIGEQDARRLKEIFGRGQDFGGWDKPRLKRETDAIEDTGVIVLSAEDYKYNEYYASYADLERFLQSVSIFEDFDPKADKALLEKYVAEATTKKGIVLPRHRIVLYAQKSVK